MSKRGRLLIGCAALVAAAPLQQSQTNNVPINSLIEDHVDISIDNNRYQHDADNRRRRHKRRRRRVQESESLLDEGVNNLHHQQQQYRRLKDDNEEEHNVPWQQTPSSKTTTTNQIQKETRIIGGQITPPSRYPYVASLLNTQYDTHVCGGTLIAPDIILTAGHCAYSAQTGGSAEGSLGLPNFDSIMVGLHNILDRPIPTNLQGTYNHLIVEKHISHPSYTTTAIMNDYSIAKLYGQATNVNPVRINNRRNVPLDNDILNVFGWGVTSEGISSSSSDKLQSTTVNSISNKVCSQTSGDYEIIDMVGTKSVQTISYNGFITDNMMCAHSDGKDAW